MRARGATQVVLAVPVGATESVELLTEEADEVVCVEPRDDFVAVGAWYDDFSATSDDEVVALLEGTRAPAAVDDPPPVDDPAETVRDVVIPTADARLPGTLVVPSDALGVVVFAHGSGSSRFSPRNREVARHLQTTGQAGDPAAGRASGLHGTPSGVGWARQRVAADVPASPQRRVSSCASAVLPAERTEALRTSWWSRESDSNRRPAHYE